MQYTFKSNINCGACVAKVTDALNDMLGENAWKVDTSVKDKPLTIESDALDLEKLETVLSGLGYKIQPLAPLA
jgi:copper chaperone